MKNLFLCAAAGLLLTTGARAQNPSLATMGCATVTTPAEIQEVYDFVQNGAASKTTAGADTIPIVVHIVGTSQGTGYYSRADLYQVICETNEDFKPVGIYFSLQWPIRYINNSTYYNHNSSQGFQMMSSNNVSNAINIYFVENPAGACGYFSPGADGIAINNSCAAPGSTTVTHEIGHYLGLPHTFFGWENGNTPSNPERVVRTGPNANCNTAGDGFCDTEADFQSYRWICPYTDNRLDPLGVPYKPDSSYYMGYATDACMSRFTAQQISRMQTRLYQASRINLVNAYTAPYVTLTTPQMQYPTDTLYTNDRTFRWAPVAGADYYAVRVQRFSGLLIRDTLVQGTQVSFPSVTFSPGLSYQIRVRPLAATNLCQNATLVDTFTFSGANAPSSVSGPGAVAGSEVSVYPNPAGASGWNVALNMAPAGNYTVSVLSPAGAVLRRDAVRHNGGTLRTAVPAANLTPGVYFLRLTSEDAGVAATTRVLLQP